MAIGNVAYSRALAYPLKSVSSSHTVQVASSCMLVRPQSYGATHLAFTPSFRMPRSFKGLGDANVFYNT